MLALRATQALRRRIGPRVGPSHFQMVKVPPPPLLDAREISISILPLLDAREVPTAAGPSRAAQGQGSHQQGTQGLAADRSPQGRGDHHGAQRTTTSNRGTLAATEAGEACASDTAAVPCPAPIEARAESWRPPAGANGCACAVPPGRSGSADEFAPVSAPRVAHLHLPLSPDEGTTSLEREESASPLHRPRPLFSCCMPSYKVHVAT